jgi:two-component system response regulator RegX3
VTAAGKLLVVDGKPVSAQALCRHLAAEGFVTRSAPTAEVALTMARSWCPDLVLLDLLLPDGDGLSVCRELRRTSTIAIIIVTARSAEVDRVAGLEVGADDYVTKPFSHRELSARVRAVLRRTRLEAPPGGRLVCGKLELQLDTRKALIHGRPVDLAFKEFELLKTLMGDQGRVVSRADLYRVVWRGRHAVESRTLDVHIRALRRKIEPNPQAPVYLTTVHGVGYRLQGKQSPAVPAGGRRQSVGGGQLAPDSA